MKVQNMTENTGREVPNQFIIVCDNGDNYFQSYKTIIAKSVIDPKVKDISGRRFYLDNDWDYSKTTGKYRNQFLGETRKETEAKIKDGTYIVTDLNS